MKYAWLAWLIVVLAANVGFCVYWIVSGRSFGWYLFAAVGAIVSFKNVASWMFYLRREV